MSKKIETLICECHSVEHIVLFSFDTDWDEVFMSFHLRKISFWKRLIYGIKYIFGHQCNYGAFDEVILKAEAIIQKTIHYMLFIIVIEMAL